MDLELGVDDLDEETQAYIGLLKEVETGTGTSAVTSYYENSAAANNVGVGYMRVRRKAGVTTFQGIWIYKTLFSKNAENSQTKGETIEWQTPTVNGRCMGLSVDSTGEATFRKIRNFDTESDAEDWLDGLAGISA